MSNYTEPIDGAINWDNVPGGDIPLDELLRNDAPVETPQEPQTYAGTYRTREETEKGIAVKDALIEDLRKEVASLKGVDPLNGRPVAPQAPAQPQQPQQTASYFNRVVEAVNKAAAGDPSEYEAVQREFIFNQLGPAVPLLVDTAKDRAVSAVDEELPGFRKFFRSPEYTQAMDKLPPVMRDAVRSAEGDIRYLPQLTDLYKSVYLAALGLQRTSQPTAPAVPQTTPRPTMTSGMQPPPSTPAVKPNMATEEGRKAIIEAAERSGLLDKPIR